MHRRDLLGAILAGGAAIPLAGVLAGCGSPDASGPSEQSGASGTSKEQTVADPQRIAYGDDPSQFGELHLPRGGVDDVRGVVVVIHGGFWRDSYDLSLGTPLAEDLADRGWAAWNLEYRRVDYGAGGRGGVPATLDDIATGIDRLAEVPGLDTSTVITLGHSAGGQLAAWAAARTQAPLDRWQPVTVPVTHVISQAGVLDFRAAGRVELGNGAVDAFIGGPAVAAGPDVDPIQQVPLTVPVWCVHGTSDPIVPLSQSQAYVDAASSAGATAELVRVEGDHFTVIDTGSDAWRRTLAILDGIAGARR